METRVAPDAFRHAQTARGVGLGVTRVLRGVSAALLGALVVIIDVAVGLGGWDAGRFLPGLLAAIVLGAYAATAPAVFDRVSRSATAPVSVRWLALLALGHAVGWTLLLLTVRG